MAADKHTPGPLHVTREINAEGHPQHTIRMVSGQPIAVLANYNTLEQLAHAKLFAAAPELLQELKNLRRAYVNLLETGRDRILFLGGQCDDVPTMAASDPYLRYASAAIAKATGAQS